MKKSLAAFGAVALISGGAVGNVAHASPVQNPDDRESVTTLAPGQSFTVSEEEWTSIATEPETSKTEGLEDRAIMQANTPAPACVNAVVEWGFVQVYNNCGFDVRVKVVLAFGPDSACHLVVDGTRHNISPAFGRIDRGGDVLDVEESSRNPSAMCTAES